MADRTVYGQTHSENGWRMVDTGSCVWVKVPGTNVTLQIREGKPAAIMGAFAADYNAHVEPLRDGDSACWTATNSVSTSNHLSGTGMDLNWNGPDGRTFRLGIPKERAYPGDKARKLDELIEFYEGMIFCGGNWSIRDWMHFQMGGNTYGSKNVDRVNDFIRRKIRADGFSTFKRSGTVTPPPVVSPPPAATILARATGITQAKAEQILPQVSFALTKANCTNPRRIAAALAQWVIESGHFVYTEEIASGPETQERWKYKGRTWVQLTWEANYRGFSQWVHSLGLVPTPDYFVVRPRELAEQKWAALGPAYWWAIKYPRINEYADRGDIDNVSKWVNAPAWVDDPSRHANGEAERRAAYNKALALGDQLLVLVSGTTQPPPTTGDDMSAEAERKIDVIYQELTKRFPSRSPLRHLGEGLVDTVSGFVLNIDGSQHVEMVKLLASLGHPESLALLREVAGADPGQYPDRQADRLVAQAILAEVTSAPVKLAINGTEPAATTTAVAPQIVYVDRPVPSVPEPAPLVEQTSNGQESTGQIIGRAYDALEALRLADALPIESRAPLAALISVLSTKNGAQI